MDIRAVLFDMDGTLVPMDMTGFTRAYFHALAKVVAPLGYEPHVFAQNILKSTEAMIRNDGSRTNEQAFWSAMSGIYGEKALQDKDKIDAFYLDGFRELKKDAGFEPLASATVRRIKANGIKLVLASNPIFPRTAQVERLSWANIAPSDFCHMTSYENSRHCKPNPDYYTDILEEIGEKPENCLMVGNDAVEDAAASKAGINVFILTDCLEHGDTDYSAFKSGSYGALNRYLGELGLK